MLVGEQSPLDGLDVGTGMDHKKDQYSVEANTLPLANCHYELISAGNWFFWVRGVSVRSIRDMNPWAG